MKQSKPGLENFFTLTPERVLDTVEEAIQGVYPGARATGRTMALNSLENRVYELEFEAPYPSLVAKFYRPGRWSPDQIAEEHRFTDKLAGLEIPVVTPLRLQGGHQSQACPAGPSVLESREGILFTVFPKVKGRIRDELADEELRMVGRYLGRLHNIGEKFPLKFRDPLTVERMIDRPAEYLRLSPLIPDLFRARFHELALRLSAAIKPRLAKVPKISLHGDCHLGNTLWGPDGAFFLDFDDLTSAPVVQDIWMVVRGNDPTAVRQRETLLNGYELMRAFPYEQLTLIEPLRAMRMIHYSAWIAHRWDDPIFPQMFSHFTTAGYWQEEIEALLEIENGLGVSLAPPESSGGPAKARPEATQNDTDDDDNSWNR